MDDSETNAWPFTSESATVRGTTPMPNVLFDSVMPTLSDTQLRVLLVVARSTLGWRVGDGRKERDWLSHRQLQTRTGRAGAAVSGAIDALVTRGLLEVQDRSGEARPTTSSRRAARGPLFYRLGEIANLPRSSLKSEVPPDENLPEIEGTTTVSGPKSGSTSERRLHKAKTTKENETKENKPVEIRFDLSSLGSEVLCIGEEQIAYLLDVPDSAVEATTSVSAAGDESPVSEMTARPAPHEETEAFIRLFQAAYSVARPGESCPPIEAGDRELLERYLKSHGIDLIERWLPAFFASDFGYVRRRSWSLGSYLNSLFVLRAKQGRAGR